MIILFRDWVNDNIRSVLLIEPNFPIPAKSRNHKNFLPIGLLKIAGYFKSKSVDVELIRHNGGEHTSDLEQNNVLDVSFNRTADKKPDLIFITSIFTYWAKYVREAVIYYKKLYPDVPSIVGGIYASLMPEHCLEFTGCDDVIEGQIPEAEEVVPAYDLVDVDYQIIHTTRGCIRQCDACGVYDIEPIWSCKKSIKNEICKKKIIFYDNNLLANEYIENILYELIELKKNKKISYIESQSGFDGRILVNHPYLATLIKKAGFKNPKIAWDGPLSDINAIFNQISILCEAGFNAKDISVFMLYNHELSYEELEKKRVKCFEMGVQITDCRFRPLDSIKDNYNPRKHTGQTSNDYFIHPNWTDKAVRKFRRNVRRHNICIRHDVDFHSSLMERKKIPLDIARKYQKLGYDEVDKKIIPDAWTPKIFHEVNEQDYFKAYSK